MEDRPSPQNGAANTPLYFPHVDTSLPWQTEIALINTSGQEVTGTLKPFKDGGLAIETDNMPVTLPGRGRKQITVANEFTNPTEIGYIIFDTDSPAVQGYTKLYQTGSYRWAVPAVKEVNTSGTLYVSHIASNAQWWTELSLLNTTSSTKNLTITFNNGQSRNIPLAAHEHKVVPITSLFNGQPPPDIHSAVITGASGIVGMELFGSTVGGVQMGDSILLTGNTAPTIYYPYVAGNGWWTGIVAYNTSASNGAMTIMFYDAGGDFLSSQTLPLAGKGKYIGGVADLGFPAATAWFKIDSTLPLTGFELFGNPDNNQLAAYAGGGTTGAKTGAFPKIEKNGWTGIAFVNTEASPASVTLTAYKDDGTQVGAPRVLSSVGAHARVVNRAEDIFLPQDISSRYLHYLLV